MVQLSLATGGKMNLNIIDSEIFIHISMNITLNNIYVLIGEHFFIIFFSLFVILKDEHVPLKSFMTKRLKKIIKKCSPIST